MRRREPSGRRCGWRESYPGVRFRPFVPALATGLGLTRLVGNDLGGVFAGVEGAAAAVGEFPRRLEQDVPRWPG